jgi:hypothetical protein
MHEYAPIAIFTYKRPEHTLQLFESLAANPEAQNSQIVVYSDGPKTDTDAALVAATRDVVRRSRLPRVRLVARSENLGLAANVIDGVTELCELQGRVIVLEDDLRVSRTFLSFMNEALDRYVDAQRVMHVSGYMFPVQRTPSTDAVFLPFVNVSGWGTWKRAWDHFDRDASGYTTIASSAALRKRFDLDGNYYFYEMLEAYRAGKINSWAIRWYLSMFMLDGLAVYPGKSLVQNCGYGAGGTHTTGEAPPHGVAQAHDFRARTMPPPAVDVSLFAEVKRLLSKERSFATRVQAKLRRWRGK